MMQSKTIASAVARMVNLQSFIWDTSTKISEDLWLAISSLAHPPEHESCLRSVWIRFHSTAIFNLPDLDADTFVQTLPRRHHFVDYPTLSIFPPLESITILDIDEPSYLEEMALLIERSRNRLRTLCISIDCRSQHAVWANPPNDSTRASSKWPKLGGVLEVLKGSFQDTILPYLQKKSDPQASSSDNAETVNATLKPEILGLERIALSVPILMQAIDWTKMISLTILRCQKQEKLWRNLRRQYAPSSTGQALSDYPLKLKHLHIDCISASFMLFIKDTLAQNTLETVFLHGNAKNSGVDIDNFYRTILYRHRLSLKRIIVNVFETHSKGSVPWKFKREMLAFISSARMPHLCELHMSIDASDWVS